MSDVWVTILGYLNVRPAGCTHLGVKSCMRSAGECVSRTAKVSIARWNLKEVAGKALARRTETACEAVASDEKDLSSKSGVSGKGRRLGPGN